MEDQQELIEILEKKFYEIKELENKTNALRSQLNTVTNSEFNLLLQNQIDHWCWHIEKELYELLELVNNSLNLIHSKIITTKFIFLINFKLTFIKIDIRFWIIHSKNISNLNLYYYSNEIRKQLDLINSAIDDNPAVKCANLSNYIINCQELAKALSSNLFKNSQKQ